MSEDQNMPSVERPRRLTDLYQTGKQVTIGDSEGAVTVYMAKPNDLENRKAIEKAQGARVTHLALRKNPDDPRRAQYEDQIYAYGLDDRMNLINIVISEAVGEAVGSATERIAAEPAWADDDYLIGLREAWTSGLENEFTMNPEDEEARKVFDELMRFESEVEDDIESVKADLVESMDIRSTEELTEQAVVRLIEIDANNVWTEAYMRWRLYYAVRDNDNRTQRYFESIVEIETLDPRVFGILVDHFEDVVTTNSEGKG